MNRKMVLAALALLAAALGYYLYTSQSEKSGTELAQNCDVNVGYSKLRISLPVFIAESKGYFKEAGIKVCLQPYDTAQPLMQAMAEGKVDAGGYTALPITFAAMQRSGKKLRFASAMLEDKDHRVSYLLVEKNSKLTKITDLRGKRIGILPTVAYQKWLEAILREAGVDASSVTIQQIEPTLQAQALKGGGIDALFTNDPVATAASSAGVARLLNANVEVPSVFGSPFLFGSFNIRDDWAGQNPEKVAQLVTALNRAIAYVNAEPAQAKQLMMPFLAKPFQGHILKYPDALYLATPQTTQAMFDRAVAISIEEGILAKPVNLNGLVIAN